MNVGGGRQLHVFVVVYHIVAEAQCAPPQLKVMINYLWISQLTSVVAAGFSAATDIRPARHVMPRVASGDIIATSLYDTGGSDVIVPQPIICQQGR